MTVYVIKRNLDNGWSVEGSAWYHQYDTVSGFVISALNELEARILASEEAGDEGKEVWLDHNITDCTTIDKVSDNAYIILRSFHAG